MAGKVFGTVATGHAIGSDIAAEILRAGGNAFDAICAAAFATPVLEPMLASLGGGGFLLARTESRHTLFDFFVNCPGLGEPMRRPRFTPINVQFSGATQIFHLGPGSVAVPGVLKGLLHVHDRLGSLPLCEIVEHAVQLARNGVPVDPVQGYVIKILHPIMCQNVEGESIYAPNARLLESGDVLKNPGYAAFLDELPRDRGRSLYEGELAAKICRDLHGDSQINMRDLAEYQVVERAPIKTTYRGYRVYTNPPPALGGQLIVTLLKRLESSDMTPMVWGSAAHLGYLGSILRDVEEEKNRPTPRFKKGTTHLSIADANGNFASLSLSNGEGSGYFVPGTGIMLNNMLGEDDLCDDFSEMIPGARIPSMMSPCILSGEGKRIITGSGGSKRIRSSLVQVISNIVDFGHSLERAICSPRINWDDDILHIEPGYDQGALDGLQKSLPINCWDRLAFYFGGAHSISPGQEAIGDPRRGGAGIVVT